MACTALVTEVAAVDAGVDCTITDCTVACAAAELVTALVARVADRRDVLFGTLFDVLAGVAAAAELVLRVARAAGLALRAGFFRAGGMANGSNRTFPYRGWFDVLLGGREWWSLCLRVVCHCHFHVWSFVRSFLTL